MGLPSGLSRQQFEEAFLDLTAPFMHGFTLFAPLNMPGSERHGECQPVGLVLANTSGHRLEPHVTWMPWATDRNKVEAATHFLNAMREKWLVVVIADKNAKDFYTHLMKLGILNRVGRVMDWFRVGEPIWMFQTMGLKLDDGQIT